MMDDSGMSTNRNIPFSQPSNTLANIFNVFAGDSHDNIASYSLFLF